jgi:hypothetical protein
MRTNSISIKYLIWFAVPTIVFFIIAIPLALYYQPISGDLTRIGHWSERDYGWLNSQPEVVIRENGVETQNPQVLVLGDSFSRHNIWQSYLASSRQLDIQSFDFQQVGCIENWIGWVLESHSSNVKTIILQIVERGFISMLRRLDQCSKVTPKPFKLAENFFLPTRPSSPLILNAGYLIPTVINSVRLEVGGGDIRSGQVANSELVTNVLFSNRKSNRLLYYLEDDAKKSWSAGEIQSSVDSLKKIQDRLAASGLRLVVVIVPDKSTVYRPFMKNKDIKNVYPDISTRLDSAGINSVNLVGRFQISVKEIVDLYLPNDTHLSTQGYKLMAEFIAEDAF